MSLLTLEQYQWYAWEMIPGYAGRYYSPIKVEQIRPLKTGNNLLRLDFYNMRYAEGVRDFSLKLKVLKRVEDYILVDLLYGPRGPADRCAFIWPMSMGWLQYRLPQLARSVTQAMEEKKLTLNEALEIFG